MTMRVQILGLLALLTLSCDEVDAGEGEIEVRCESSAGECHFCGSGEAFWGDCDCKFGGANGHYDGSLDEGETITEEDLEESCNWALMDSCGSEACSVVVPGRNRASGLSVFKLILPPI